jgi:hypothetical protein
MSNTDKSQAETKSFDEVSFIMAYEGGTLANDEIVAGFQTLIDSGVVWQLQGSYGRMAQSLIDNGLCTRPAKPPETQVAGGKLADVGPFVNVSRDQIKTFENGRSFRFVLYGAYNAGGLIGSEYNGVAVLDEDNKAVLADNFGKEPSGYYGPSKAQTALFDRMLGMDYAEFCDLINSSDRRRYALGGDTGPTF